MSNERRQCPVWGQRAAGGDGPVVWDYHVILAVAGGRARSDACPEVDVLDLDCAVGVRLELSRWLEVSFPRAVRVPAGLRPWFRVVDGGTFIERFASDRRHMRAPSGWRAAPPPWPPIGSGAFNLFEFVDMSDGGVGAVVTLRELTATLRARLTCRPPGEKGQTKIAR